MRKISIVDAFPWLMAALIAACVVLLVTIANAAPGEVALSPITVAGSPSQQDVDQILAFLKDRKWGALSGVVIYWLVRLLKSDIKFPTIIAKHRIYVVWVLSVAYLVVERVAGGVSWQTAITDMLTSLVLSVVLFHQTFIASIRDGKEIPVPGFTIPGAQPSPNAPVTVPMKAGDPPPPPAL